MPSLCDPKSQWKIRDEEAIYLHFKVMHVLDRVVFTIFSQYFISVLNVNVSSSFQYSATFAKGTFRTQGLKSLTFFAKSSFLDHRPGSKYASVYCSITESIVRVNTTGITWGNKTNQILNIIGK